MGKIKPCVKWVLVASVCTLVLGCLFYYFFQKSNLVKDYFPIFKEIKENTAQLDKLTGEKDTSIESNQKNKKTTEATDPLPLKINNPVPFIPQAPFANWDHLHGEACEEAAIIIAHYYLLGEKKLSKQEGEAEILKMVAYQQKNYGAHTDLDAQKIITLAQEFYGDKYQLVQNYLLEDLKKYLAQGSIIIVPVAGRVLANPYFKQPGPLYHALVITGYDEKKQRFITNDPGTKRGEGFQYSYKNLLESIHDFPGKKERILEGEKVIILVQKQ
ncbi:MAG: C39 family peptidase [Patescibacteria group bacterium]|nr:C39 family peptidase [Patescibacteria group bacterium]